MLFYKTRGLVSTTLVTCFLVTCTALNSACQQEADTQTSVSASDRGPADSAVAPGRDQVSSPQSVRVLFFGDSITAGYGLQSSDLAYPKVFEGIAKENNIAIDVTAAGNSGETTSGGLRRIDWVLKTDYDIVVVELGGNDGLRGIPVATVRSNLEAIVDKVNDKDDDVRIVIAGMRLPPSMGKSYVDEFEAVFSEIAEEKDLELIPFILDGVAGDRMLNQFDGIHPTAKGHEVIGRNVWTQLEDLVRSEVTG